MNYQCNDCGVEFEDLDTIKDSFGESVCPDCGSNNTEPMPEDFYIEQTGMDEEDMLINGIEKDDDGDPIGLFF